MSTHRRQWKQHRASEAWQSFSISRYTYFQAIRKAKERSWTAFLSTAEGKDIFQAYKYTKPRMVEKISPVQSAGNQLATDFNTKCKIFLQVMYSKSPDVQVVQTSSPLQTHKLWPLITDLKIQQAIQTSSPKKAPGPDDLSFAII